jgi:hypothetical protein
MNKEIKIKLKEIIRKEKEAKAELKRYEKKYGALSEDTVLQRRIYNGYHDIIKFYETYKDISRFCRH